MTPWEDRYVRELVDDMDRLGRVSSTVAAIARSAIEEGRYRDALDAVLAGKRSGSAPTGNPEPLESADPIERTDP